MAGAGAAGLVAAVVLSLPPATRTLPTDQQDASPLARGAFHVHTRLSDGTGTVESVAAAAGRAGLNFVILTDHGDGTRVPEPPVYLDGVLVIEAVEISTNGGHVIALGMRPSAYPLAGDARDVVEDIARLGGVSIAAHPASAKADLRWADWSVPVDGIEWLNGDSEWRDEGLGSLARVLLAYPFRPVEAMAATFDRPDEVLRRWDGLLRQRPVFAIAAADVHARIGLRGEGDPDATRNALRRPSYEQAFRTSSVAIPRLPTSGDAGSDAEVVIAALLQGNAFSAIDGLARQAWLSVTANAGGVRGGIGDRLPADAPVAFEVDTNAPADATVSLVRDGSVAATARGAVLRHTAPPGPGTYRVEVALPGAPGSPPVPWIVSNPIYVGPRTGGPPTPPRGVTARDIRYDNGDAAGWNIEHSPRAQGALDVLRTADGTELSVRWALGGSVADAPYVALTMPAGPIAEYDRLMFTARASTPVRISIQVRAPGGAEGERWHRTAYLDDTPRRITVAFDEMTPRGPVVRSRPARAEVRDVLFVIEGVNTKPGSSGQFWIDDVAFVR